ncbi:c-type cytochrome [Bacillus sp. NP157]|nr:c-type cytochrome [Bacillus sp. NP157]
MTSPARPTLPARLAAAGLLATCLLAALPAAAGDAKAGQDVFKSECSECHSVAQGRNKKGPSLFGIVGRKSGSIEGYAYSDALQHVGWTWSPEQLHTYLSQPAKQANPGTKMKYDGLDNAKDLDDLLAYLATLH